MRDDPKDRAFGVQVAMDQLEPIVPSAGSKNGVFFTLHWLCGVNEPVNDDSARVGTNAGPLIQFPL